MRAVICLFIAMILSAPSFSQKPGRTYPLVRISALKDSKSDTVRIKAYVFDIYVCPPCPPGAQCKPCIENNFIAVDEKPVDPLKIGFDKRLRVFTQKPDTLKQGKRYLLTVRFRNKKVSPSDNVTLVSFKPL